MEQATNRRVFLQSVATATATAAVVGFSSTARAWVAGGASSDPFARVPPLDGQLLTDAASRAEVGQDLGHLVFHTPSAVLRPGSIADVERMVRFCARHCIQVAARGQGHSTDGQSQVDAGLVIDMRTLNTVHEIGDGYAIVDAGSTWRNLLEHTLTSSQSPPVLTGFIGLSIGGTLSMGGISGMAYKIGVQIEHVEELTVVTGRGTTETCSQTRNRALFNAVLAGVGQYGIIVRAKLRLVHAPPRAHDLTIRYDDLATFMTDIRILVAREEFDMVWGGLKIDPATSAWYYELYTTTFHETSQTPDDAHLLRGLHFDPANVVALDGSYYEYQTRVDMGIAFLQSIGVWDGFMHPWFDAFLPDSTFEPYLESVLPTLGPTDMGMFGFVLLFPLKTSTITRPMFRLPDDDVVFLFDILTLANAPGYDATYAAQMRERNRDLFEQARDAGGTRYPIGTLPFTQADWRRQYGPQWIRAQIAKTFFDPANILTPGPGIFPR